jgi:eukaryotic-like serine/threonine-protein kinase
MSQLRRLINEVHHRSLWQVLSIYLVGSWIGYQVVLNLTEGIGLPAWVPGFAVVLFIIGLPVVLATAFVQEGLPVGDSRRRPPGRTRGAQRRGARRGTEQPPEDGRRATNAGLAAASEAQAVPASTAAAPARAEPPRHLWLLTWQRAILGGIVAFLLLGITAGGYMGARNAGIGPFGALIAAGKLDERDRLLIADFGAADADLELADALTQAFRIDLTQSPVVTVVEPRYARELLQRMGRDGSERLGAELAREAALRDGIKAVVVGDVARAGRGYVLSASLVATDDGAVLAAFRESAADSAAVLPAVDRLSRRLRERIGESLRSVHRSAALPAVTTTSVEALRLYTRGVHAMEREQDFAAGVKLLEEALAIDSAFGMAWSKLADGYYSFNAGRELRARAATKAYELRDRMTPRERLHASAVYHMDVTGDRRAAIEAYRTLLEEYPQDGDALNNIALLYTEIGDHARAIPYYERAIAADSTQLVPYTNLVGMYTATGRYDEAERLLELYTAKFGETTSSTLRWLQLHALRGAYDAALDAARRIAELRRGDPIMRAQSHHLMSDLHALRGQLQWARLARQEATAAALERGNDWAPLHAAISEAQWDVWLRGAPAAARQRLDRAVEAHPPQRLPALNRPYRGLADTYAVAGDAERARYWLAELEREVPAENRADERLLHGRSAMLLAWADKDYATALRLLERYETSDPCRRCVAQARALILDRLDDERAVDAYERYLATPHAAFQVDINFLAVTHERLADLYAERGDNASAARHAARFVELWQDADAEFQPRVAARRALLRSLTPDR